MDTRTLNLIDEPGESLVVGIQLPDKIFINKGNSDGKYIWTLDRRTKKILLYSRAANFLPFVQKSKSGTLITSTELNTIREDALKSPGILDECYQTKPRRKTRS